MESSMNEGLSKLSEGAYREMQLKKDNEAGHEVPEVARDSSQKVTKSPEPIQLSGSFAGDKTLAEQTANATKSISDQISGIQGATGKTVEAIENIGEVISEMNNISAAIAAAMEEQRAAASEITRAAHEAASGTREVAESIGQVDAAAAETGQCAAQVNSASHALNTESSGLRKAVGEFLSSVRAA